MESYDHNVHAHHTMFILFNLPSFSLQVVSALIILDRSITCFSELLLSLLTLFSMIQISLLFTSRGPSIYYHFATVPTRT